MTKYLPQHQSAFKLLDALWEGERALPPPKPSTKILKQILISNENENEKLEQKPIDAMHCIGKIKDHKAIIIIDSGAVSNIISNDFLKKINWKIQRSSNINLVGINGIKERPLGEVIDLPITLSNKDLKINALVIEKGDYDLLLGNDWAHNNASILDWKKKTLTFEHQSEKIKIPVSCLQWRNQITKNEQLN